MLQIHLKLLVGAAMTGASRRQDRPALGQARDRSYFGAGGLGIQLRECLQALDPFPIVRRFVDDDIAAHRIMPDTAQFGAQDIEFSGSDRFEPEEGDHAGQHIHLGAEFGHVKIVNHVDGAQQHLDRLTQLDVKVVVAPHVLDDAKALSVLQQFCDAYFAPARPEDSERRLEMAVRSVVNGRMTTKHGGTQAAERAVTSIMAPHRGSNAARLAMEGIDRAIQDAIADKPNE